MLSDRDPMPRICLDRRRFLGVAAGFVAGLLSRKALALAGPHKVMVGDAEVTVVSDGHLVLPTSIIAPKAPPDQLKALLDAAGVTGNEIHPETNISLVRAGSDLVLFDTGSGTEFQPTAGKVLESLQMAGVDPASITRVVFTHAHPDHVWGTVTTDGKLNFPNASYYVGEAEWNFWMGPDILNQMPKEMHPFVLGAQKHLNAVKDRIAMLKPGDTVASGIQALDTFGHTPGHLSFEVAGGDGLIIAGDAIASPAVFFPHPEWAFGFDAIADLASASRARLLDRAAAAKTLMLGYHWPYPGLGYAEKQDTGFRYVPA
jgi:glyoxylase-like metal-dependent hydrolase (beta-lactamase superfamily II)